MSTRRRSWHISFLFLPLASMDIQWKISTSLLLPTPASAGSPALSLQHHSDTDESPIFTCIFHFPYIAGYLPSLPASQTHNFDVKVSLLKIELLIFPSNSPLLATSADNITIFLDSRDFKFHGPFNSFRHPLITAQTVTVLLYDISNMHPVLSNPSSKLPVQGFTSLASVTANSCLRSYSQCSNTSKIQLLK